MPRSLAAGMLIQTYNAIFNPSEFVGANVTRGRGYNVRVLSNVVRLLSVFVLNLVIYAVPITLAGFGSPFVDLATPPVLGAVAGVIGITPAQAWDFLQRFIQNCLFITLGAGLTFAAFHTSVWISRSSAGILPSLHTVVYSTSAYLAGIFSVVWFIATDSSIAVVDGLVLNVQKRFIYAIIDLLGVGLTLPSGRPEPIDPSGMTTAGQLAIAVLVIAVLYFVYSMYLGSRLNHGASGPTAILTVAMVGLAPLSFVLGSILMTITGITVL